MLATQSCPTLCDPIDCSPPGSSVRGIFQARVLAWVAMSLPGDLPDSGFEPGSLMSPALASRFLLLVPRSPLLLLLFFYYLCYLFRAAHRFSLVALLGLFLAEVSPVVEHGLSTCGVWV